MQKPTTVLRQEYIEKQIKLINGSGLPAFVLVDILEDTLQELRRLAESQYQKDKKAWDEYQEKEAGEETK